MSPPIQKVVLLFFTLVCIFLTINSTEGKSLRRARRPKTEIEPSYVHELENANNGMYARSYGYGEPVVGYAMTKREGKNLRQRKGKAKKVKVVAWNGRVKNYAKRYRTWAPSKEFLKNQVYVSSESRPVKKRRRPAPSKLIEEDYVPATTKRRRKVRPHRGNAIRPTPPPEEIIYDEYEEYFPEETKRQELDYEYSERPREKKRRKPEVRKKPKKPNPVPKYPYVEDERILISDRFKLPPGEPTVSYSNFVQHPITPKRPEYEYDYPEEEESRYIRNDSRRKRKRVKKKSNNDRKREPEEYRPDDSDRHPPVYTIGSEYEGPQRVKVKSKGRPQYDSNTIYGEGHISTQNSYDNRYQDTEIENSYRKHPTYSDGQYRPNSSPPPPPPPPPAPSQFNNPIFNSFETQQNRFSNQLDSRPYRDYNSQNQNNFSPQAPDFSSPPYTTPYKNQPNSYESDYGSNGNNFRPNSFSNGFSNPTSSGSLQPSVFRHPSGGGSQYQTDFESQVNPKGNFAYENGDNFFEYSSAANVNKGLAPNDYFSNFNRQSTLLSSLEKNDPENEFMTKHQNLYNNGISGIPVQGDGFGANRSSGKNKDYDIGYGEFQFDENPNAS